MLAAWATKWGVPAEAMLELVQGAAPELQPATDLSEAAVSTNIRLAASAAGWRLWRNNVGAYKDDRGNFVRYGLCNESKQMNGLFKSSDMIGIRPVPITWAHVGSTIGQFVAIEAKHGNWKPGKSKREQAQAAYIELVRSFGGHARFSTGEI